MKTVMKKFNLDEILKPTIMTCARCGGDLHVIPYLKKEGKRKVIKTVNICGNCTFNSAEKNMREIKFRARNANLPRCWIYGYFIVENGNNYILNEDGKFQVIAGTEGQFTGCRDKNGKEIYEGDIITSPLSNKKIIFDHGTFCAKYQDEPPCPIRNVYPLEVIGNIYENPELTVGGTI